MKVESAIRLRNELAEGGSEALSEVESRKILTYVCVSPSFGEPVHARAAELGRMSETRGMKGVVRLQI